MIIYMRNTKIKMCTHTYYIPFGLGERRLSLCVDPLRNALCAHKCTCAPASACEESRLAPLFNV